MSPRISVRIRPGPASGEVTAGGTLGCLPGAKQASDQHELPQVIGVVVREAERLAQYRLPGAMREAGEQVRRGVAHQSPHGLEIALHLGDARVPGAGVGWRVARRPVARGPLRGDVFRALREFHDVPLRDADVLEETPG